MNTYLYQFLLSISDKSPRTRESYERVLTAYFNYLDANGITPLGEGLDKGETMKDVLSNYIDTISRTVRGKEVRLTPATKRTYLSTISSFYAWAKYVKGETALNPAEAIFKIKRFERSSIGPNIQESEFKEILKSFSRPLKRSVPYQDIMRQRDHCIMHLAGGCGIRRIEIHRLNIRDYDRDRQVIRVLGKGNKPRTVPVPDIAATVLCHYIDQIRPTFPTPNDEDRFALFLRPYSHKDISKDYSVRMQTGNITDRIGDILEKAGITKGRGPHTLRRSYGAWLLDDSGGNLRLVQEILGHANISTTERYTALSNARVTEQTRGMFRERGNQE